MKKKIFAMFAVSMTMASPVFADPLLGLGLTVTFGGGKVDTGLGLRLFSDDKRDSMVGSVGLDYMFKAKRFRPTIGAAYLGDNGYVGLDMGFDLNGGGIDFGLGAGGVGGVKNVTPSVVSEPSPTGPPVGPPTGPSDVN